MQVVVLRPLAFRPARPAREQHPSPIVVLGMHRSGTSCVAGSLQRAGLNLGSVHTWNENNLRGNRENQDIVDLHDAVLADNGGAWDRPPARAIWRAERTARARSIAESLGTSSPWGFKDPRALLLWDGWAEVIPDARIVGVFRHPCHVAASIRAREGKPEEESLRLWLRYNTTLLELYERSPFPLLDFDADDSALKQRLSDAARTLGLDPQGARTFFTRDLRHHSESTGPMPTGEMLAIHDRLTVLAGAQASGQRFRRKGRAGAVRVRPSR